MEEGAGREREHVLVDFQVASTSPDLTTTEKLSEDDTEFSLNKGNFLDHLRTALDDPRNASFMRWLDDGVSIYVDITNPHCFDVSNAAGYFVNKSTRTPSIAMKENLFRRQMNMYGFTKRNEIYTQKSGLFTRDDPDLQTRIIRGGVDDIATTKQAPNSMTTEKRKKKKKEEKKTDDAVNLLSDMRASLEANNKLMIKLTEVLERVSKKM